jgi:hypothetical protein
MVARKRIRKRSWLRTVLLFVFIPLAVWSIAFVSWLYWNDITRLVAGEQRPAPAKATRQADKPSKQVEKPPAKEKIPEEDRRKLDEILKKRQ